MQTLTENNSATIQAEIEDSARKIAPAWPLQSTVAVNPFWFLRDRPFYDALNQLTPVIHADLFMPLEYYLDRFQNGAISEPALVAALEAARERWPELPASVAEFVVLSRSSDNIQRRHPTLAEHLKDGPYWQRNVTNEVGRYAAAYFDEQQALAKFPFSASGSGAHAFWEGWLAAQKYDRAMHALGAVGFSEALAELNGLGAAAAIEVMLGRMGLRTSAGRRVYLQRLMASVIGWASQFQYQAWQKNLGYTTQRPADTIELLAVRLAYDFGLFAHARQNDSAISLAFWQTAYNEIAGDSTWTAAAHLRQYVWQCAFEFSYQKRIAAGLQTPAPTEPTATSKPRWQFAFCIDVRSEMIRRRVEEAAGPDAQTIGVAGFFGLPLDYQRMDERGPGHRLPVLLVPALHARECATRTANEKQVVGDAFILSFFRNLRKGPLSSFLFVELFGILSIENMIRNTWQSILRTLRRGHQLPARFDDRHRGPGPAFTPGGERFDAAAQAERARQILKQMGLSETKDFAGLVFLVGHGSVTTNNAFASALDCGACGGHAGDINVRLLAAMLNDPDVRARLARNGLTIPETTHFVPAVHETVTDDVFVLDADRVPSALREELRAAKRVLKNASAQTRLERQFVRSPVVDRHTFRRSRNWSELRPEWGLAGNACFIVAPRERSAGLNLGSRAFLHDYDWKKDDNFQILEAIMTAPMVVTNWINMQYYASTAAPGVFGAGNKVLHNLVNETGVVEGNGGDLRVGLPMQSVHDGERFTHEPLRLSVFIEAPRDAIEGIIAKHATVRELVDHGWLHLIHVNPDDLSVTRRTAGGKYGPV